MVVVMTCLISTGMALPLPLPLLTSPCVLVSDPWFGNSAASSLRKIYVISRISWYLNRAWIRAVSHGKRRRTAVRETVASRTLRPDRPWGPRSPLSNGYRGSFLRVKRRERAADHSPPSSAEGKNDQSYTSSLSVCLQGAHTHNPSFGVFFYRNFQGS
jgi:hypothetical protein